MSWHAEPRPDELPLSFAQERLWFLEQLGQAGPVYHLCGLVQMQGTLEVDAMRRSFAELVQRHEILRTRFEMSEGRGVQRIDPPGQFEVAVTDLRGLGESEQAAEVQRYARQQAQEPFDLGQGPLLRVRLLLLSGQEQVLLLGMHHIISDGWSLDVLVRELGVLYGAYVRGEEPKLAPLPAQYADYAIWQRQWLQGELLQDQLRYWKERLAGAPATLDLPTDRPRPARASFKGAAEYLQIPAQLAEDLHRVAREERTTLFMLLLAAYQLLLSRWSGEKDVVVGSPIAGRRHKEFEALIGFFVNALVLRTDLSGNPSFRELLGRVKEVTLGAYEYQDVPFEKLVQELNPQRDLSRHALFQNWFVFENVRRRDADLRGLNASRTKNEHVTTQFDLSLHVMMSESGLQVGFEYATDLFDPETIRRMADHWQRLLEGIVADPGRRLSQLASLGEAERRQVLVAWNQTEVLPEPLRCVQELFAEQARRSPEAIALVCGDQSCTYAQLEIRSNQIALRLAKMGVGPDVIVGLCLERSIEMVVGLLGILKAGGAYLPLDPDAPAERLSFMLEDAGVSVLVSQEKLQPSLPVHWARVLNLDGVWADGEPQLPRPATSRSALRNLAYVIYTSGSTGRPKGVMVEHAALANHMQWMLRAYSFDAGLTLLHKTPLSFDASVWEIFAPLLCGGRMVLARPAGQQDPGYLWKVMAGQQVTTLQLVPSMLRAWLQEAPASAAQAQQWTRTVGRRQLFSGGEPLTPELRAQVFQMLGRVELHNLYGPTETCIQTVVHSCTEAEEGPVPIGRPISNVQLFILDADLEPVPIGVGGELYIGGAAVARGYLNRPGLTAARFVANPFGHGDRVYRTGDLARYRADGSVEYLGRIDSQVKVNGYRIEPAEVEVALQRHALVKGAVVVSWRGPDGVSRLVAYVVPLDGQTPSADSLREATRTALPHYMVPSAFVVLSEFPRTSSGKVDRTSLPAPGATESAIVYVPPRTELEQALCDTWAQTLGRQRVGIDDNFFDLGGHSLLATRVLSHIRKTSDLELSLRVLFEEQTVRRLAARMGTELERRTLERELWQQSLTQELTSRIAAISDEEVAAQLHELRSI